MTDEVFAFDFDRRVRPLLAAGAITARTCGVRISADRLLIRFGLLRLETAVANVVDMRVTGPYELWRSAGVRMSRRDSGITFGTSAGPGVCILFDEPVRVLYPHEACTVTVAQPHALVARWRAERLPAA